ncbi:MAG: tetratricopeptide repeat protein [Pedobacter sp.]|nr:MAG: tetratricopeptide repeat protein [Pedobacter sp.]
MNMRLFSILILLFAAIPVWADPIADGNKCWDEKNYQCMVDSYREALTSRQYDQKDYATIQYRMGFGYNKLKRAEDALKSLREAIRSNPTYGAANWELAYAFFQANMFDSAGFQYRKAAAFYNTDAKNQRTIYYWEAYSWFKGKKYANSITAGKQSYMLDSSDYATVGLLGDACYNNYQYANAHYYYTRGIQISPNQNDGPKMAVLYFWRGKSSYNLYKYADAMRDFEKVLTLDPKYRNATREIAFTYDRLKSWKDAINFYSKSIALFNDDNASMSELFYARAVAYYNVKDYSKSLMDCDSTIRRQPQYFSAYHQKAKIYSEQKKYKEALDILQRRIEADASISGNSFAHFDRGEIFMILKDTSKAFESFKLSIAANSYLGDPRIALADIYFSRKQYLDAITNYQKGLDDFSFLTDSTTESTIYTRKGLSNYFLGYRYTASADFKSALQYDKKNKMATRYLGELNYVDKNYTAAEDYFTRAIELYKSEKDSLVNMYNYRGMARTANKKYTPALEDYNEALKLKPKDYGTLYRAGQLEFELKNYTDALATFNKMLPLIKPDNKNDLALTYYCRGRCYFELNKKAEAKSDFAKALELVPTYAEAKQWLEKN